MRLRRFKSPQTAILELLLVAASVLLSAALSYAGEARQNEADEWDKVLARARKDGRVTLGSNLGTPEFRQGVTTAFAKRYGVTLEIRVLEGAELVAVAGRECAAGRASMDVLLSGLSELITLHPKGCLAPVKTKLLLPEVADGKYWRGGNLKFNDLEGQYFCNFRSSLLSEDCC